MRPPTLSTEKSRKDGARDYVSSAEIRHCRLMQPAITVAVAIEAPSLKAV